MAAGAKAVDPTFADVVQELHARGMLGRVTTLIVGSITVQLHPAFATPPPNETPEEREAREAREREELTYGSSV